ncbi:LysR family transcriptional regulator [Streptomyces sp. NA02950]|uniref:LysR family transcriptional regulator n=1 Tax=Streptomyces sp. NA02950 TaxID=2742137 RepID=UPI0020CAD480|nr:LysR family transcriptional regulator [Streptomyces sp. NA02950]
MLERQETEVFLTLAEELHFGRTADRLRCSPGRVSQIVKGLERRIGATLFLRTSRRVTLSAIGAQLRDDLQPAHRLMQQAYRRAVVAARGIAGPLRVGYSTPWAADAVLRAGAVFSARHPECTVEAHETQFADPYGPLRSGELDVQISEFPVREADLTAGPVLFAEPRALMVPAQHPLARQDSVCLEDLARAPLITFAAEFPSYWLECHLPTHTPGGQPIARGPAVRYWAEVLSHVAAGHGVAPVAARAEAYHARPGIAFAPFRDAPTIDYGLLWPTGRVTPAVQALVTVLCETVAAERSP